MSTTDTKPVSAEALASEIEALFLDGIDQATRSKAPWQLNPAPNEDIHHHPGGARSASAACGPPSSWPPERVR